MARFPRPRRRLTLAHENGHLWLDYLLPRQRILRDAPDLLEVIDGHRPPTDADRARAASPGCRLACTPTCFIEMTTAAPERTMHAEDDASVYALELLAPWD